MRTTNDHERAMRGSSASWVLLASFALAACSEPLAVSVDAATDAGTPAIDAAPTTPDASTSEADGGTRAFAPVNWTWTGVWDGTSSFAVGYGAAGWYACEAPVRTEGCDVQYCRFTSDTPPPSDPRPTGSLTVLASDGTMLLAPDTMGVLSRALVAGERVRLRLEGTGELPIPDAEVVVSAPPIVTVTEGPAIDGVIALDEPIRVRWEVPEQRTGVMRLALEIAHERAMPYEQTNVWCDFPLEAGEGEIAASVAATLPVGPGMMRLLASDDVRIESERWYLRLGAAADAVAPGGAATGGPIRLARRRD